jgi:CreA protein
LSVEAQQQVTEDIPMKRFVIAALAAALPVTALAEEIGAVSTVHKWLSPDHKIVIEAFR